MKRLSSLYWFALLGSMSNMALAKTLPACCCPPLPDCPRYYLDVGIGQTLNNQINGDSIPVVYENSAKPEDPKMTGDMSMYLARKSLANNFSIGFGSVWSRILGPASPYLPYVSFGAHYKQNNINRATLGMMVDTKLMEEDKVKLDSSLLLPYSFNQKSLGADVKFDLYRQGRFMPYIKFGLGMAWNQTSEDTYNMRIGDKDVKEVKIESPSWSGRSFTHSLGFGVDFIASCNLWVSLGYQYDNYGVVKIKQPTITLPKEKPDAEDVVVKPVNSQKMFNLGNFKTHSIQLTARYLFG
jgi:opacity protein-like surface antigen